MSKKTLKDNLNKMSFPMQGEVFKRETTNGYYNPTSVQSSILRKKNATATATRERLASKGVKIPLVSTRAPEPEQSAAFKNGYRNK
jgi:hypothetical protein|tara:strand:- start:468 stop:725 length:258 start_codon:yes stop_codon:yes gene_type:complete